MSITYQIINNNQLDYKAWEPILNAFAHAEDGQHIYRQTTVIPSLNQGNSYSGIVLKTKEESEEFKKFNQNFNYKCDKMPIRDIINITRILCLNADIEESEARSLRHSLNKIADQTEEKYYSGVVGTARKIMSVIRNLFINDSVKLLFEKKLKVEDDENKKRLPFFIGTDAQFARLVANELSAKQTNQGNKNTNDEEPLKDIENIN